MTINPEISPKALLSNNGVVGSFPIEEVRQIMSEMGRENGCVHSVVYS